MLMRKFLLFIAAITAINASAQTVSTFENLPIPGNDTFYVNFNHPGYDVGFQDGYVWYPCVYDTGFGFSYWSYGFSYSNMHDSSTAGFMNQYAARAYKGHGGSNTYAVAYGSENHVDVVSFAANKQVKGFWVTNSTYAYKSMKDGDAFAKKFGGATGNDPDWFKLTVKGFIDHAQKPGAVDFYLADFRDANNTNDYIVGDWKWVDLTSIGSVDSLSFTLTSSDTSQFGMNTPAYFCIDDFEVNESSASVKNNTFADVKIYPNPATDQLFIDNATGLLEQVAVIDMAGRTVRTQEITDRHTAIDLSGLQSGVYLVNLTSKGQTASIRFQKQ